MIHKNPQIWADLDPLSLANMSVAYNMRLHTVFSNSNVDMCAQAAELTNVKC